ncbi:MAG: phosphotransferase [Chloroflexota bacterium]
MAIQERLRNALFITFPYRAPLRIEHFAVFTSGWANNIYAFDLIDSSDQTEALVLKQFSGTAKAGKEARALEALSQANYPVPRVLLAQDDLIVMERFAGAPLWTHYEAADSSQRDHLTTLFVRLLLDLQALDPRPLVPEGDNGVLWDATQEGEIARLREDLRSEFSPVIDWLDAHRVRCTRPVISHRDYHPWNVLLDDAGRAVVLDWDWEIADARFDLAWMLTLMQRSGFADFSTAALAAYERLSGQAVEDLAYFEVLTTTRWWMNVSRSLQSSANLREGAADEFRAFLEKPILEARRLIADHTGISLSP